MDEEDVEKESVKVRKPGAEEEEGEKGLES